MTQPNGPSRPVLIVEPSIAQRERLYDLLTRHGVAALTVHSGEHAIKALRHQRPCLVVSATSLADMSGSDLAERVREVYADLPIVLFGPTATQAANGHIQAMLTHDIDDAQLLREMQRWIGAAKPAAPRERWPGHVLVVDDDARCRFLLQEFLELHGLTVAAAESGEAALKQLATMSPSVVLLDVKMSGMDGLLTLKKIKAMKPATVVFMITGLEEEETMRQALELGAHDYITKPFSREYLETALLSKILLGQSS